MHLTVLTIWPPSYGNPTRFREVLSQERRIIIAKDYLRPQEFRNGILEKNVISILQDGLQEK